MTRRLFIAIAAAATCALSMAPAQAQTRAATPLKITVYGGSGAIGSRIVSEALARGHAVRVVDRSPRAVAGADPARLTLVTGDVFSAADLARNMAGQDVVVTAVAARPAPTRDFYVRMVKGVVEAQRAQGGTPKTRLLVVGGAGSLNNAQGKRLVDTFGDMPPASQNEIMSMVEALDYLRTVDDTSWSFFSPAASIFPGERTGKFRLGGDELVVDAQGRSSISMEDYAVAMLDEIENPRHRNRRFTAGY